MASSALISGGVPSTRLSMKLLDARENPEPQSSSTWGNDVVVCFPWVPS